jgi:arylsulfatase A-like enzyme/Flp pilus assembly protein TadD
MLIDRKSSGTEVRVFVKFRPPVAIPCRSSSTQICYSDKSPFVTAALAWWVCPFLFLVAFAIELQAAEPKSNVIVITIDTVRPDHLGCYGYKLIQTPNIDALARTSARFSHAYTPVPITLPAHSSLFTGSFPMATGVHDFASNTLPASAVTLAEILHEKGYATGAFLGAPVLDSRYGLNQGFDTYFDHFDFSHLDENRTDEVKRQGDVVIDEALVWLKQSSRRPFFLWVHLYDAHYPYAPPEPYASRYKARPYDGEIAFADAQIGRLLSFLKGNANLADSLVVLAADHGEGLGEHGEQKHGFFIYDSTVHVPLIVKVPGATPRVVTEDVSLVDVMPSLLQALHIPIPSTVQGRSLLNGILGRPDSGSSNVYAETYLPLLHFSWSQLRGLRWKGIKYIEAPRPELYDATTDPHETKNLLSARPAVGQVMRDRFSTFLAKNTPASGVAESGKGLTDPALLERLRGLGYATTPAGTIAEASGKQLPDPKDRVQVYELFWEAMADGQHGRLEESLRKLHEAKKIEPDSLSILFLEALDYFQMKDFPQAIQLFSRTLELKPTFAQPHYYLGVIHAQTFENEAALENFKRALELDPANFSAAFGVGSTYLRLKRIDEAASAFQEAIRLHPDYAEAFTALGEIYLYQKRVDDAVQALERAVAIAPQMKQAHYRLGQAYEAKGLPVKAQEELDRANSLSPVPRGAQSQ